MCDVCCGLYDDEELIDQIRCNDVDDEALMCEEGWSELSRIWGRYGWGKKIISSSEWRIVCKRRGEVKFGN